MLPSESEAYRLLDIVSLYIGQSQSHFDVREVCDNIDLYYADPGRQLERSAAWFLRMIIILAIGKLLRGDNADNRANCYPGSNLFEYVHASLPNPSMQHSQGRVAIETLTLLGVYLQAMNRKEEAYIYTSIALRLAVTHGYHRPLETSKVPRWEKAHIGRLWWTIYMQERRLAAATGHPYGIDDDFIMLDYPIDQPGFSSSHAIRTNARIARVTSRVLTDLYSPKRQNQDSFVLDVKEIIKCLHEISREIPENLATIAERPNSRVSVRTNASLQLMLYQATLLTIRPVMLHVAHLILAGESSNLEHLGNSSLAQLCRASAEASRRVVRTILTLRKMNLLTIFGFFDCDALFSAAFVLLLTVVFDSACEEKDKMNPSPGLGEALQILQYLADNHNTNAIERLHEVKNLWHQLSEHLHLKESTTAPSQGPMQSTRGSPLRHGANSNQASISRHNTELPLNLDIIGESVQLGSNNDKPSQLEPHFDNLEGSNRSMDLDVDHGISTFPSEVSQIWMPSATSIGTIPGNDLLLTDIPLDEYHGYFQSLLDNSDWCLTGQDVGDLAEFGRHVENFSKS
ncbi:hypothetical protein FOXG_15612 [Fusarium oxysporum f. sp. lycopersici 4287]|nr:hypothetical protein FOXG_15612 [Fusarium oxysporum f. sp. lycopersici 4287]KNB17907.1 hypothetical protein FOXG_15612 [Fusarium oxysporum f. sp. lycopersici 4287]